MSSKTTESDKILKEANSVPVNSTRYWELRCKYLEMYYDPTYTESAKDFAYKIYRILKTR